MKACKSQLVQLVSETYITQGLDSIASRDNLIKTLVSERRMPATGWSDLNIEYALQQLALMDSNNFQGNAGLGEREGRVYSSIVQRRHFAFSHGIGRSGDLAQVQPKAAGSSVLYKITNYLTLHAMHLVGATSIKKCLVVPMATGMTISLCLNTLRASRPSAKYVIWSRIDQKSCFKAILTAGYIPLIVQPTRQNDEITTSTDTISSLLEQYGEEILCVISTTSCFAPRTPDKIDIIARLCQASNTPHLINNAYGLQCPYIVKLINRACAVGRVDLIVQSTDKNFVVPVGGAVVSSPSESAVKAVSELYPGRASASPIIDMFITLLSMGVEGWQRLHTERLRLLPIFINQLQNIASKYNERVLLAPHNTISIAISLSALTSQCGVDPNFIGSMLFQRSVSGTRVIPQNVTSRISGHEFIGWGASICDYPVVYMTAACALGLQECEIQLFCTRLEKVFDEIARKQNIVPIVQEVRQEEDVAGVWMEICNGKLKKR